LKLEAMVLREPKRLELKAEGNRYLNLHIHFLPILRMCMLFRIQQSLKCKIHFWYQFSKRSNYRRPILSHNLVCNLRQMLQRRLGPMSKSLQLRMHLLVVDYFKDLLERRETFRLFRRVLDLNNGKFLLYLSLKLWHWRFYPNQVWMEFILKLKLEHCNSLK
jgi:hypothetical protein